LIAYFIGNISAKEYQNPFTCQKLQQAKGGTFFETRCKSNTTKANNIRTKYSKLNQTRRPASADRTARRQFQATGQPVSRTQASDAMTSRLPR